MVLQKEMTNQPVVANFMYIFGAILGIIAFLLIFAYLKGIKLPIISEDRTIFFVIAFIGFLMCTSIMSISIKNDGWTHPMIIIASLLGIAIILLVAAFFFHIELPFIRDDRDVLLVLAGLIALKFIFATGRRFLAIFVAFF